MDDDQQQRPSPAPHPTGPPTVARPTIWHSPSLSRPGRLSANLARRLLNEHTQTGQVVVDLDDDPALRDVASALGRDHHALAGRIDPAALALHAGGADLVLLHWPRPAANPQHLLQTAHALLSATGLLAISVHVPTSKRTAHLIALTGAAHTAGLQTVRHIVVVAPADEATELLAPDGATHPYIDLLILRTGGRDE